jgi:polar amino acid transport system substrate-binding protein
MRPLASLLMFVALLGAPLAQCAAGAPLQLCFEDAPQPPWTMPDGRGLNLELLKRVEAITGERFVLSVRPWARCVEETRIGRMDGMIGAADSPERRRFSVPPRRPDGSADAAKALYLARVDIFVRAGSGAAWDGRNLHNPRGVVITQRSYFVADLLRARGQRVIDTVKSSEEALRLLASGSADVAALMANAERNRLRDDPRLRGQIAMAPAPYAAFPLHLMFSQISYDRDPARIEAIWSAIAAVRASPGYRQLEAAQLRRAGLR